MVTGGLIAANAGVLREALLDADCREDGRSARESRPVTLKLEHCLQPSHQDKSRAPQVTMASVAVGKTRATATVSARIEETPIDRAHEGSFSLFVDCDRELELAFGQEKQQEASRCLDQLLKHGRALDLESLCIVPGRLAWSIRLDVRVAESDGNVLDACAVAAVAAMKSFVRPDHRVSELASPADGGEGEGEGRSRKAASIVPLEEREGVRLTVHHSPFTVSFVAFAKPAEGGEDGNADDEEGGDDAMDTGEGVSGDEGSDDEAEDLRANFVYAIDATLAEESCCDARVVAAADSEGYLRLMRKLGGRPLPRGDLTLLARLACVRARELGAYVEAECRSFDERSRRERVRRKHNPKAGAGSGAGAGGIKLELGQVAAIRPVDEDALGMDLDDRAMAEAASEAEAEGEGPRKVVEMPARPGAGAARAKGRKRRQGPGGGGRKVVARGEGGGGSPAHLRDALAPGYR